MLQQALQFVIGAQRDDILNASGYVSKSGQSATIIRAELTALNDTISALIVTAGNDSSVVQVSFDDKVRKGADDAVPGVNDTFRAVDANELKGATNRNAMVTQQAFDTAYTLNKQINPFVVSIATDLQNNVLEIGTGIRTQLSLNWQLTVNGNTVQVDSLQLTRISSTDTLVLTTDKSLLRIGDSILPSNKPETITYQLRAVYDGQDKTATVQVQLVPASYFGQVDTVSPDAATISALSKSIRTVKAQNVVGISMNNKRYCFAYPMVFGELSSIHDINGFEYLPSYTHVTTTINDQAYHVYTLTQPCSTTNYAYSIS
jgi:hypothetical protein